MDVRAWRARVLAWSGQLADAEKEYLEIVKVSRTDPDNWMGLAGVYLREGRAEDALRALDPRRGAGSETRGPAGGPSAGAARHGRTEMTLERNFRER